MFTNRAKNGNNIGGRKIKELRKNLPQKTSQEKLAEMFRMAGLDIDKNAVQRIESGQRFVTDIELKVIQELLESVENDEQYINARRFSDIQNARTESDRAAGEALIATMKSGIELYREVQNNPSFKKLLFDSVFDATYIADSGNRV